eukprot:1634677-Pyramimonas_sp.AAC.1
MCIRDRLKRRVANAEVARQTLNTSIEEIKSTLAIAEAKIPSLDIANIGDWSRAGHIGTWWCGSTLDITKDQLQQALTP